MFRRIILLGPAHRVWIERIAFPGVEAFETPLGRIPLAVTQIREFLRFPEVQLRDDAHLKEHCLGNATSFSPGIVVRVRSNPWCGG